VTKTALTLLELLLTSESARRHQEVRRPLAWIEAKVEKNAVKLV